MVKCFSATSRFAVFLDKIHFVCYSTSLLFVYERKNIMGIMKIYKGYTA